MILVNCYAFAKAVPLHTLFQFCGIRIDLVQHFQIHAAELVRFWHDAIVVFVGKHQRAVDEVPKNGYQLVIVACLKIFPGEIVVFGFWGVCRENIAQNILLTMKLF